MNPPRICYIIAASPRSGSQLLGSLLTATGLAGFPDEHFNPWHMGDATNYFPEDLFYGSKHIDRLIKKYSTSNGVFGTKAHFLQVTNFVGLDQLESLYPTKLNYISLTRINKERQGLSLAKAVQTDSFNSTMVPVKEPTYNFYQILQCIREVRIQTQGWETFFSLHGIKPFRITYEDFVRDQTGTIKGVLEFLGIDVPLDFQLQETHLKKQADSLSELWLEKFNRNDRE